MTSFFSLFSFADRITQSYRHYTAAEKFQSYLISGIIFNLIAIGLRLILRFIIWSQRRRERKYNSLVADDSEETETSTEKGKRPMVIEKILDFCASIVSWYGFIQFAVIPPGYWGFRLLDFWVAVLLSLAILSIRYLWGLFYHKMINSRCYIIAVGILIVMFAFGTSVMFEGSCVVFYDDTYGILDHSFSTRLIRQWQLPNMCPPGPPCHVYATLAEDASSTVFITAQTSMLHPNVSICWQPANVSLRANSPLSCSNSTRFEFTDVEPKGQRYIHSVYIGNLTADTLYEIQVVYLDSDMEKLSEKYDFVPMDYHSATGGYLAVIENYRTLPNNQSNREITIVMGGDAGYNSISVQLARQAAAYKPDLIVIAGDVAYDNGIRACYYTWDQFFSMLKPINQQKGLLVPLVLGMGNHDVGKDTMCTAVVNPDDYAPLWYLFFPQHSIRASDGSLIPGVPNMSQRKTYFYNKVGNLLLVSLDAGYQESMSGEQLKWWKSLNDNHTEYVKMVNYHNPIYWSSDYPQETNILESLQIKEGLAYWVPEIDRSGYRSAWENHVHVFKRTFPIKGGLLDEAGTIYLGDGNWGADPNLTPIYNQTGILATFNGTVNSFWLVHINSTNNTAVYSAIDKNGVTFDQVTQELKPSQERKR